MATTDCAAAALTAVLRFHGIPVTLIEVRRSLAPGRDGVTASALLRLAKSYGLKSRGVQCQPGDVAALPRASVLFWRPNHFVVLDRVKGERIDVVDPATGRRTVSADEFGKAFTGVALLLEAPDGKVSHPPRSDTAFRPTALLIRAKWVIARIVLVALLAQSLAALVPLLTGALIDRVVPRSDYSLLWLLAVVFTASQAASLLGTFVRAHLMVALKARLETALTVGFLRHLSRLPYSFFQQHTSGDLLVRVSSNDSVRDILTTAALGALVDGTTAVVYLLVLIWTNGRIAAIVAVLALARIALLVATGMRQRRLFSQMLDNQARSHTAQIELLTGMEALKGMAAEPRVLRSWTSLFFEGLDISMRRGKLDAVTVLGVGAIGVASTLALMFYGTVLVLDGTLTLGAMLACAALAGGFTAPLNGLIAVGLQLQTVGLYIERIADVMNTPQEPTVSGAGCDRPFRGSVELKHVSFRYSPTTPLVVEDISFRIEPGQRVAITGPTGSGKSTIARLLSGLYEPESGAVLFDGVDLRSLDRRWIRSQLGIVTQDVQLFTGTIRSNIALADSDLPFDDIVFAATVACIHDDIMRMPLGYETQVVDRGLSLSGGQRQRLAIARAIARRPRMLILDEATSHLDTLTQDRLKRNLAALACTQILIAHRLSTIRDADVIIVIEDGRTAANGSHAALLAQGGTYAALAGS